MQPIKFLKVRTLSFGVEAEATAPSTLCLRKKQRKMYMGLYMRFCPRRATPGRILQVSTNLLWIQIWDQHLASSLQQEMLALSHGDVFYPSEKHSWSNFLGKKGQEKNEMRSSGIQIFLFTSLYAIQRPSILNTVWKTYFWTRAQRAVSVLLGDTHIYCNRLHLSKDRGLDPRCHRGT